jgi:cytochrome P450
MPTASAERFLEREGATPPYSLIPFGGGPRRCIGASFATMEMKTVLRVVLERVELRAADARPERARLHHVTLVPARGARAVVVAGPQTPGAVRDSVEVGAIRA